MNGKYKPILTVDLGEITVLDTDPWETIECPVCRTHSIVSSFGDIRCMFCHAEFSTEPTKQEDGYVIYCSTEKAGREKAAHNCVMGSSPFMVVFDDSDERTWLVWEKNGSAVSLELFVRTPTFGAHSNTVK